jgi:hypothetical protein
MARLRERQTRNTSKAYSRVFGNEQLGRLISRVHATSIANGNELEKIINELIKKDSRVIDDFDKFIMSKNIMPDNVYLIPKTILKKSEIIDCTKQPDFVILKIENYERHCFIIELKDGDNFDTKKSAGEKMLLQTFEKYISTKIQYTTSIHICCFNQSDKNKIITGFKNKINENEAMTGEEFCKLLKINYLNIIDNRKTDQLDNLECFIEELLNIDIIKKKLDNDFSKNKP